MTFIIGLYLEIDSLYFNLQTSHIQFALLFETFLVNHAEVLLISKSFRILNNQMFLDSSTYIILIKNKHKAKMIE